MIALKLKEILSERRMTQKQLAELTGIHEGTVSELVRDVKTAIYKEHLDKIMDVLDIKDVGKIIKKE